MKNENLCGFALLAAIINQRGKTVGTLTIL